MTITDEITITSEEDLITPSMSIIIDAGDGRKATFAAGDALAAGDYAQAFELLEQAQLKLRDAHRVHTECIQAAATESIPYSLLFTHAEDTLMTAQSEFRLLKKLVSVFQRLDERLAAIETKCNQGVAR